MPGFQDFRWQSGRPRRPWAVLHPSGVHGIPDSRLHSANTACCRQIGRGASQARALTRPPSRAVNHSGKTRVDVVHHFAVWWQRGAGWCRLVQCRGHTLTAPPGGSSYCPAVGARDRGGDANWHQSLSYFPSVDSPFCGLTPWPSTPVGPESARVRQAGLSRGGFWLLCAALAWGHQTVDGELYT